MKIEEQILFFLIQMRKNEVEGQILPLMRSWLVHVICTSSFTLNDVI